MKTTKRNKKSSLIVTSAVLLSIMLTASACGANKDLTPNETNQGSGLEQPGEATPTPGTETPDTDNTNGDSGVTNPDTANPETDTNTGDVESESDVKTAKGTFGGLSDSHSIEVVTDEGPMGLQFTDEFSDALNKLALDTVITFEYTEKSIGDQKQYWLKKLIQ